MYFHAHRSIPSPTLTLIIQYRGYLTVKYHHLCTNLILILISSVFCEKAALVIHTLALISSSLLASCAIRLPRYLKRVTCSNGTLSNVIHRCIPFGFAVPFIITNFVFLTLISIPYASHVLFSISFTFCIFSLVTIILHHQPIADP